MAGAPPVAQQVHVQLELAARRRQRERLVVQLLERRAPRAASRAARRHARRGCRRARLAARTRTAARRPPSCARRRGARRGTRARLRAARGGASRGELAGFLAGRALVLADRVQDRLDPRRLDLRDAPRPDRLLDLREAARRGPVSHRRQPGAQAQERNVAVPVVRRLREHGQDPARRSDGRAAPSAARRRSHAGARGSCAPAPRTAGATRARGGARGWSHGGHADHRTACIFAAWARSRARGEIVIPSAPREPGCLVLAQRAGRGGGPAAAAPLYLHGVPTSSDDWLEFLARTGGVAPICPASGGRASRATSSYTIEEYDRFLESFLDVPRAGARGAWSSTTGASSGSRSPQRLPERIERLVIIDAVPFLPGYRWHRAARIWRTPVLGEFAMGRPSASRCAFLGESNVTPGPLPEEWIERTMAPFDQGTQRAILRLYRSSPPAKLAAAGSRLGELRVPALSCGARAIPTSRPASEPTTRPRFHRPSSPSTRTPGTGAGSTGPNDRPRRRLPERRVSAAPQAARAAPRRAVALLRRPPAWTLTALLALGYLILAPQSPDLAAASYRSHLFSQLGFTLWDNSWYGGHHLPAYSVIAPALGAADLPGAAGGPSRWWRRQPCSKPRSTGAFRLARPAPAGLFFAIGAGVALLSSRVPFDLGLAIGLASLVLAQRGRWAAADGRRGAPPPSRAPSPARSWRWSRSPGGWRRGTRRCEAGPRRSRSPRLPRSRR